MAVLDIYKSLNLPGSGCMQIFMKILFYQKFITNQTFIYKLYVICDAYKIPEDVLVLYLNELGLVHSDFFFWFQ